MPHMFAQLPFPKASLAVLKVLTQFAGIEIDFAELAEQSKAMEEQLGEVLAQLEQAMGQQGQGEEEDEAWKTGAAEEEEDSLSEADREKVEQLFEQARQNRAKAFELKGLLDKLEVFAEYEDRFLDLFKKPGT
jgi:hypothetical protein